MVAQRETASRTDGYPAVVLVPGPGGTYAGRSVHPGRDEAVAAGEIAVLPDASTDYGVVALTAAVLIVERGGALAHVSTVVLERGTIVVRVENARKLLPAGALIEVDVAAGRVVTKEHPHDPT